jgi:hypothetical protein
MRKLRTWAGRKGTRWIVQQSARALTACMLTVAAAAHSNQAFGILVHCTVVMMAIDGLCLWTGSRAEGRRQREAVYEIAERIEAHRGAPIVTKYFVGDHYYHYAYLRGAGASFAWIGLQLFAFGPLAAVGASSTVPFFLLLAAREFVSRFGPFTVPTAYAAAALHDVTESEHRRRRDRAMARIAPWAVNPESHMLCHASLNRPGRRADLMSLNQFAESGN